MIEAVVLPVGYGQMCNQLFQVAHWIPTCSQLGIPLYFPAFHRYSGLFTGTCSKGLPSFPTDAPSLSWGERTLSLLCSRAARLHPRAAAPFLDMARAIRGIAVLSPSDDSQAISPRVAMADAPSSSRSVWVRRWLVRDNEGVLADRELIRSFFSPVEAIRLRVSSLMEKTRRGVDVVVGVHMRRGDYRKWAGGQYYFDDAAYAHWMRQIAGIFDGRSVRFLLVSNEPLDLAAFSGIDAVGGLGEAGADLYSLAACDYLTGPPSTFTGWASFWGGVPLLQLSSTNGTPKLGDFVAAQP